MVDSVENNYKNLSELSIALREEIDKLCALLEGSSYGLPKKKTNLDVSYVPKITGSNFFDIIQKMFRNKNRRKYYVRQGLRNLAMGIDDILVGRSTYQLISNIMKTLELIVDEIENVKSDLPNKS